MNLYEWRWKLLEDERLTATERHVGLTLHVHMRPSRPTCYPSVPTLAAETARSASTVKAATAGLERAGYLERKSGKGRGHSTVYTATFENVRISALSGRTKRADSDPEKGRKGPLKGPDIGPEVDEVYEKGRHPEGGAPFEIEDHCVSCGTKLRESLLVNGFCLACAEPDSEAVEAQ